MTTAELYLLLTVAVLKKVCCSLLVLNTFAALLCQPFHWALLSLAAILLGGISRSFPEKGDFIDDCPQHFVLFCFKKNNFSTVAFWEIIACCNRPGGPYISGSLAEKLLTETFLDIILFSIFTIKTPADCGSLFLTPQISPKLSK